MLNMTDWDGPHLFAEFRSGWSARTAKTNHLWTETLCTTYQRVDIMSKGIDKLSDEVWRELCSYLDTETVLKLLATGSKVVRVVFKPRVLPEIELQASLPYATLRKTLVFMLHNHRHIERFKMHSTAWAVAIPFLGSISFPTAVTSIIIITNSSRSTKNPFLHPREEDRQTLVPILGTNICYQSFERFERLTELSIDYSLPAARQLADYSGYWTQFFASLPRTITKLSIVARGFHDALLATELLPNGLIYLSLLADPYTHASNPTLKLKDYSDVLGHRFPYLSSARLFMSCEIPETTFVRGEEMDEGADEDDNFINVGAQLQKLDLSITRVCVPRIKIRESDDPIMTGAQLSAFTFSSCTDFAWGHALLGDALLAPFMSIPRSLREVSLISNFHVARDETLRRLLSALPPTLEKLTLGKSFSEPRLEEVVPRSLKSLAWKAENAWDCDFAALPPNLTHLSTNCFIGSKSRMKIISNAIVSLEIGLSAEPWHDFEIEELDHYLRQRLPHPLDHSPPKVLTLKWTGHVILTDRFYPTERAATTTASSAWSNFIQLRIPSWRISEVENVSLAQDQHCIKALNFGHFDSNFLPSGPPPSEQILHAHKKLTKLQLDNPKASLMKFLPSLVNLEYLCISVSHNLIPEKCLPPTLRIYINQSISSSPVPWSIIAGRINLPLLEVLHFSDIFTFDILDPFASPSFDSLREICILTHNCNTSQLAQTIKHLEKLETVQTNVTDPSELQTALKRHIHVIQCEGHLKCRHLDPLP